MLHGFPDTPAGWRATDRALSAAGFETHCPPLPGYTSESAACREPRTVQQAAAGCVELLESIRAPMRCFVGHDWGAAVAYCVASWRPDLVDRLIAVGAPHPRTFRISLRKAWSARHFQYLRWPGAEWWMRRADFRHVDALYRRWSPTWNFGSEATADVKECFRHPACLSAALDYYRQLQPKLLAQQLREKISVDTLICGGADDPNVDYDDYVHAGRMFTGTYEIVMLPGGHFPHRENETEFAQLMLRFLGEGAG